MASRFWAGSSSEDESDHSDSSSGSEVIATRQASRWEIDSDSESEEEVRVVRSAKDKAFDNLEKSCILIKNHMKINDWAKIQTEFDVMSKQLDKSKNVVAQQGLPKFFIRTVIQIEEFMNEILKDKARLKKMGKENNKSLIRMKGKIKRNNETYKKQIEEFRKNPESSESEELSESSDNSESEASDDDSDEPESESHSEDASSASEEDDSSEVEDDDDWPSEDDVSSSSSESDEGQLKGRAKWLKKTIVNVVKKEKTKRAQPATRKVRKTSITEKTVEEELKLTAPQFDTRMKVLAAGRGKRGTDLSDHLEQHKKLAHYARKLGVAREIVALMQLIGAQLYDTASKIDRVVSTKLWKDIYGNLVMVVKRLESNPGFRLAGLSDDDQAEIVRAGMGELAETEVEIKYPNTGESGEIRVPGDLASFVERLYDEYIKSLQHIDPHKSDYIDRICDEELLLNIATIVQKYYERIGKMSSAASMAILRAELLFYKHDSVANTVYVAQKHREIFGDPAFYHPAVTASSKPISSRDFSQIHPASLSGYPSIEVDPIDVESELKESALFVYKHGDDRSKTRIMLCHIYHHAIHDRFYEARDMLLMSHLQDTINQADVSTQILFNRMMAQLGLCAFRKGLIYEAHACLSEISTGSRTKELLAQGIQSSRYGDRNSEQEKLERRRQVPYHMHINMELLDCSHLIAAMLLEVPNMAAEGMADNKRRVISKTFRRHLEYYDRQVFAGPPENARDHIIAAAKCLSEGAWKDCCSLLLSLSVWNLIPGENAASNVKSMIKAKIQTQALKTYLLAYSSNYDSLSLSQLCEMFELPEKTVHSVVSKMMINEEIHAAWDNRSGCMVMHHDVERTKLQQLSLQFIDKASIIVENNERMLDYRSSNGGSKDDWKVRNLRGNRDGGTTRGKGGRGNRSGTRSRNTYTNKSRSENNQYW